MILMRVGSNVKYPNARSKTDPDASFVSRKSAYRKLCYKTHYSIDAAKNDNKLYILRKN
jgi:hypothetical protein